jgi:hypothetical protein
MGGGNSGSKSYKADQKNVSVYLGRKGEWPERALLAIMRATGLRSESEYFRKLFFQHCLELGFIDEAGEPDMEAIEAMLRKARPNLLPRISQ